MATVPETITEGLALNDSPTAQAVYFLSDAIGFNDVLSVGQMMVMIEKMGLSSTLDTMIQGHEHLTDGIGFGETYKFLWSILIQEGLGFDDITSIDPAKYVKLVETLALSGYATTTIQAHNLIQAVLGLSDLLVKAGLGEFIVEGLGFSNVIVQILEAYQSVSEGLGLDDIVSDRIAMFVSVSETLALSGVFSTKAVLQERLTEGLVLTTSFVSGGETYTGWVMNSENFAVTNYKEYDFTSLARIGGKYYGCKADGIYLLEGDLDDASYIKAVIRSGKMDFGTSNKKTLTAAYLGFTGNGDIVMKLITDSQTEMWYTFAEEATGLHTQNLGLAKGVIGRYWQFELVTQNTTELEIDTIEFFPIMFKRKV